MKVIVLTGLVSIEKAQLALEFAEYAVEQIQSVTIIDNIARQAIDADDERFNVQRLTGDSLTQLADALISANTDLAIVALSEQTHPEKLFVELDTLREQFEDWQIYALALIDTRTCDCFPNVREALELYADFSVMLPYQLDEILAYVDLA